MNCDIHILLQPMNWYSILLNIQELQHLSDKVRIHHLLCFVDYEFCFTLLLLNLKETILKRSEKHCL